MQSPVSGLASLLSERGLDNTLNGIKKLYNHNNKPMRVPDLKYTWISRNFRIQNIDGMGNGEWGTGNGQRATGNGQWAMGN